jgi:hypothetical protein
MRVPRVQFTVRRLMVAVALAGGVMGLAVEAPRLWRRWAFCQERAELCLQFEKRQREDAYRTIDRLARTEAIARKLDDLGPAPRSVASLIASSGDPERARRCFQGYGKHLVMTGQYLVNNPEGSRELLDCLRDPSPSGRSPLSPREIARWLETESAVGLRESIKRRLGWAEDYVRLARAYRRAGILPWESLPAELPLESLPAETFK